MSAWTDAVSALPAPYLWWKLDETSGTTAVDSSGNGQNGTYSSPTLNQTGLIPGDAGGKSVTLATTSGQIAKGSGMSYPRLGVTYAQTFKSSTDFTTGRFFQASSETYLSWGSTNMIANVATGQTPNLAYDPSALCDGNPHLVVYVVRATTVELWVDGTMVASGSHAASSATLTAFQVKQSFSNPTGSFDDVLIWSSALSSTQIGDLYAGWLGSAPASTVTLAGTLRAKTAAFTAATVASATLTGTLGAKTATFEVAAVPSGTATLDATLRPKSAAFTLEAVADVAEAALAGTLQAKAAAFTLSSVADTALVGTLRPRVAEFTVTVDTPADAQLAGVLRHKTGAFTLTAETSTATQDVDLSTFVDLYGSTTYEPGTGLSGASKIFTFPLAFNPTVTYTIELDLAAGDSTGGTLYSSLGPTEAQVDLSQWHTLDTADPIAGGTLTFTIGPGIEGWDQAVLDGEHYVTFEIGPATITAIRIAPPIGDVVSEPPADVVLAGQLPHKVATFVARAVIPITPVPAHLRQHGPAPVVIGRALGAPTMTAPHGTQPVYSVSSAAIQRARQQIVVDGVDISFLRGVRTPDVTCTLLSPLRYGPGQLDLPQVVGGMEPLDPDTEGRAVDLAWMWPGAPIEVNLVIDDPAGIEPPQMLMEGFYRGVLVAWDLDGVNVSLELGGEANGRAALRDRQPVVFPRVNDIGHQMSDAVKDLGLPVYPPLGTETGIEVMTTGGVGHIEHIQNLCAQAWTRNNKYWTIMPNTGGAYEVRRKSDTVRHATAFFDDARTVPRLRRDIAEEPNRIFVTGVTRKGQRVRFAVYPGLVQGPAPDFPGHMEEGSTGEGVRLLVRKLQQAKYLDLEDVAGGYDDDVVQAVRDLQGDAGLPKTGEVNQKTWDALYDLNLTGFSLIGAHIEPAAQDPRVRRVNRSANGTVLEFNDDYDPTVLPVDRTIDAGVGKTLSQYREFARTVLDAASAPNWVGDITFHTGALLRGERPADVTATPEIVMDARELVPTMNLWAPRFEGGTQFNVSALQVAEDGTVTATVDTRFRDALEVWDIIDRNKESRNDPARRRNMAARSSTIRKDSIGEWDWIGGVLGVDINLERGWNSFPVVGATEGQIRKARIALKTPAEFAWAVWGRKVTEDWLNNKLPKPLTVSGTKAWEDKYDELEAEGWLLFSRGTHAEPGGYWPGRKVYKSVTGREPNPAYDPDADDNETGTDDDEYVTVTSAETSGTLTGRDVDTAGFPYYSENRTTLWVTVWVGKPNKIEAGRILWPQLEAGA